MLKNEDDLNKYRLGLIDLYESQIEVSETFMTVVLTEAIRKLKEYRIDVSDSKTLYETLIRLNTHKKNIIKVEDWVVSLEKLWGKIIFK